MPSGVLNFRCKTAETRISQTEIPQIYLSTNHLPNMNRLLIEEDFVKRNWLNWQDK
jgi:hypothetical protein